jgi:hypothetical protein
MPPRIYPDYHKRNRTPAEPEKPKRGAAARAAKAAAEQAAADQAAADQAAAEPDGSVVSMDSTPTE